MTRTRSLYASFLLSALLSTALVHAEGMSAAVGKPLQAAAAAMKAGKYRDALNHIHDADSAPGKTADESFTIERMRLSAALGAGDVQTAIHSLDAVQGRVSASEKLADMEGIINLYYRAGDMTSTAQWANRYAKEGGTDPRITGLGPMLRYKSGDYAGVVKELLPRVQADEKAGRAPTKQNLDILANCYINLKDETGVLYAYERLVQHYPEKDSWTNVLNHVQRVPGFSERFALDLYRLKLATGNLAQTGEFLQMAQMAVLENSIAEAKKIVDQANAVGAFGKGDEGGRQKRLTDLINKRLADDPKALAQAEKDANASADGSLLINLGLNYVMGGQSAKGVGLVDAGLKKAGFKDEDEAKLRAGIAFGLGGQKSKAAQVLKTVQGQDGAQNLARLWMYRVQQ